METCSRSDAIDEHGKAPAVVTAPQPRDSQRTGDGIISVLALGDELARCHSLEQMLPRAVELARVRLGLERVSLLLHDEDAEVLRGTWGTGPAGELVDERHLQRACSDVEREAYRRVEAGVGRWLELRDVPLLSHHQGRETLLAHGWQVLTPVRSLRASLGVICNDAALSGGPLDPEKQALVALFASLLGNVIQLLTDPASYRNPPPTSAKSSALVRRAIGALNQDPSVTADRLAVLLSASPARLARAFRAELGVSLVQYRNRLRLERFFGVVERQGGNFSEAAQTAGFGSYAQFHRIFRKHVGVTPREYLGGR